MLKGRCLFLRYVLFSACMAAGSPPVLAAGFYLQEQSAVAMGTAFAGASALTRDASIIYYNPAGMTALEGVQFSMNADMLVAHSNFSDAGSTFLGAPVGGVDSDDSIPLSFLGNIYLSFPYLEDRLWFGIGVSTPFGLATEYEDNWFGRFDSIESELKTFDIQPSIAYRVNDWLSVGGGVDIQYATARLESAVSNGAVTGISTLKGEDWSQGYNVGFVLSPLPQTRVGVHYRSRVYHTLDGSVSVDGVPGLNEDSPGHADINLPEIVSMGVSHGLGARWTLLVQANWFGWDSFDQIVAIRDDGSIADIVEQQWQPAWSYAAGAEYAWSDNLTLRAGYQRDLTPTSDAFRTTRVPDGDRHHIAVGATYAVDDNIALNFSAMQGFMSDESINLRRNGGLARVNIERDDTGFSFFSLGFSYKFD